jgi:hypothetical protein
MYPIEQTIKKVWHIGYILVFIIGKIQNLHIYIGEYKDFEVINKIINK